MVGIGGGMKISTRNIAPGRLQSCVQASCKHLFNKQNVGGVKNNVDPSITDELARMVCRNLQRQRTAYAAHTNKTTTNESPTLNDDDMHNVEHAEDFTPNSNGGNDPNLVDRAINDQSSEGVITTMHESILGKRKIQSNFVSRIEVGLQLNEALEPQARPNIIRNEVVQINGDEIDGNTATSKTRGVGKRGMYKSYVVDMKIKGKGSKLSITIPEDIDRAIGDNARHLVNECGRVVRTKAPLNVKSWKEAFEVAGDSMLKEIQEKFKIENSGDYLRMYTFILETMQRLYRLYKCRLHYYYKNPKCGKTDDERKKNPPADLPQSQWEYLIKYFGSEEFKVISERNSTNRQSDKRVKSTTGNLSFPESEDILVSIVWRLYIFWFLVA